MIQTRGIRHLAPAFAFLPLLLISGCASLGPASILNGRAAYNDAIRTTEDQQLLLFLVKQRFGELGGLLAVTSVTANVSYATRASVNVGFGSDDGFAGNLVPFEGGIIYEENPIISYSPVQGENFVRQLLLPIPLDLAVIFLHSTSDPLEVTHALIRRINGIANPRFHSSPDQLDAQFSRLAEILSALQTTDRLDWVQDPISLQFSVLLRRTEGEDPLADEFADLLGLPRESDAGNYIYPMVESVIPVEGKIAIGTRSVWDLVQIMTAAVEVSEEDRRSGRSIEFPMRNPFGENVRIARSSDNPAEASVKVHYRDAWYSIADTDQRSKSAFHLLQILWSVRIADTAAQGQGAPVVTVGAGR